MSIEKGIPKIKNLIKGLSLILNEIIQENNTNPKTKVYKSVFSSNTPPSISIEIYLERILKYSKIEESTLIISLIYLDRVCDYHNLDLSHLNMHRFLLSSVLVALKYNEDDFYSNLYYSKVGGVSMSEINNLENEFLKLISFRLWVDTDEFDKYSLYLDQYNR